MFFNKAFEVDELGRIVFTSVTFLKAYIELAEVQEDDKSKAICCLLLAFHVQPLGRFLQLLSETQDPLEAVVNLELNETLVTCLQIIPKNVAEGLKFKKYSDLIAQEYFEALEKYNDIFVSDEMNYLRVLRDFLAYDNIGLLRKTVISIPKLQFSDEFNEELKNVLMEPINNRTIVDMLVHLVMTKSNGRPPLLIETLNLLIEINKMKFDFEIISPETRIDIYAKIIYSNSSHLQACLLQMIESYENDTAMAYIKVFNMLKASQKFVEKIVVNHRFLDKMTLPQLINTITRSVDHNSEVALRACQIFILVVKNIEKINENQVFLKLPKILHVCVKNEEVFGSLLSFVTYIDLTLKKKLLTIDFKIQLISVLLDAFKRFKTIKVLQLIMKTITKVAVVITHDITISLNAAFNRLYEEFLEAETSFVLGVAIKNYENSLIKMCLMLESNIINFSDYFTFEAIFVINSHHLQDTDDPMFPFFVRLQTSVLHSLWSFHVNALLKNLPAPTLPFDLKFVVDSVNDLALKLLQLMYNRNWNILQAQSVFCSLMKLLFNFFVRPTLINNNKRCLSVDHPKISINNVREIVKFAEHYVFEVQGEENEIDSQQIILDSLSELVKNYSTLPNVTYFFRIVKYYRTESMFKDEIELLLKFLLERNKTFEHTIGLVIIYFAKEKCSQKEFTHFAQSLEKFLDQHHYKQKAAYMKWHICAFLLNQLLSIINLLPSLDRRNDRIAKILEFLCIFCTGIDRTSLKKL